jgi:hypothetical protein
MAVDITLETVGSGYNLSKINTNFQRIEAALAEAVSTEGDAPNSMNADFDLNGYDLLNGGVGRFTQVMVDNVPITDIVGQPGPVGPTGPQGIQGPAGADGADGIDGTGTMVSVVAGTGITVDDTDPENPIVATTITQYTDELAQDAVGNILTASSEIAFTYNDGGPTITAALVNGSIDETRLDASVNASLDLADSAIQNLAGLGITASAAELNLLDGVTASTAELNILDGVTSTAAELNVLDGITSTVT